MIWTKETILAKLETSTKMVERSLLVIYGNQTADERASQSTSKDNGIGFTGADAFILSSFAEWVLKGEAKGIPEGKRLSPKQLEIARKKLRKYTRQLLVAADERAKVAA